MRQRTTGRFVVLLIALEFKHSIMHIVALASVVVALGVAYWLIRDREVRPAGVSVNASQ
jgi:hypothetical protein